MIGQIWRSLQANPSLGAYTHTCYVEYRSRLWPDPVIPSEAIDRLFTVRDMTLKLEELNQLAPDGLAYDKEWQLDSYSTTGPDGKGFDANITSPKDFKLALEEIFASLTKLRELHWRSEVLSFYSSVIDQLEASNTLDVLYVAFSACEEDYLIPPDSMPSEGLPEPSKCPSSKRLTSSSSELH